MGSSGSKAARSAASSAARKYPSVPSAATTSAPARPQPRPALSQSPPASEKRDEFVNLDAADPIYASQLRSLGAVDPKPMLSPSSIAVEDGAVAPQAPPPNFFPDPLKNPAVTLLNRRQKLQEEADQEWENVGRKGFAGRKFIDVGTLRQAITLRDKQQKSPGEIETALRLQNGMIGKLGPKGLVETV